MFFEMQFPGIGTLHAQKLPCKFSFCKKLYFCRIRKVVITLVSTYNITACCLDINHLNAHKLKVAKIKNKNHHKKPLFARSALKFVSQVISTRSTHYYQMLVSSC